MSVNNFRITRAVVPTLFTVLNMFSGFLSIVHSSEGKFIEACWFIILAGLFDSLDGVMARLTKSSSKFGVEIDSLSDVVSFGAAPAFLTLGLAAAFYGWAVVRKPMGVTEMLSPGTFGHGGAFGTQGWIDPHKNLFVVLMIQRVGLPNGDNSEMRRVLQQIAFE